MKYGRMKGSKREVTIVTAHTVTVNSLIESNKQTNKRLRVHRASSFGVLLPFYLLLSVDE